MGAVKDTTEHLAVLGGGQDGCDVNAPWQGIGWFNDDVVETRQVQLGLNEGFGVGGSSVVLMSETKPISLLGKGP